MDKHKWTVQTASILVIVALFLSACTYGSLGETASSSEARTVYLGGKTDGKQEESSLVKTVPTDPHQQAVLQKGTPVNINNPDNNYDIPIIDFVNDKTGFAVKQKYASSLTLISTKDGGAHWNEKKLPGQLVRSLDFIDANTGWLLIQEGCSTNGLTVCNKIRLLQTKDAGTSWTTKWQASSTEDNSHVFYNSHRLTFLDSKNGLMLANGSLFITRDGGSHFKPVSFGIKDFTPLYMSFPSSQTGYVAGSVGKDAGKLVVMKTTKGALNWQKQLELQGENGPLSSLGIQFVNESTGWLLTNEEGMLSGDLYRTTDGGKHWKNMSTQRTGRPTPTDIRLADADTGVMSLHPGAGPIEGGIQITHDGGKTFTDVAPNCVVAINQVQMLTAKQIWAAVDDINESGYLLYSGDGGETWKEFYPVVHPLPHRIEVIQ
jgi:photosystem II stability/assembly factor-like uncharacterized protein